jgi:hypothetical protein
MLKMRIYFFNASLRQVVFLAFTWPGVLTTVYGQTNSTYILDRVLLNPEYKVESVVIQKMRLEGIDDTRIIDFLETNYAKPRKAAMDKFKTGEAIISKSGMKELYPFSSCNSNDIGVESGNFGTWQGQTSLLGVTTCAATPWINAPLPVAGRITIVPSPATDPCATISGFPIPLPSPTGGKYSIKLGNNVAGGESERIMHQFVVQPQDTNFIYQYSVVFQDPGHLPSEQPFFDFVITAQAGDTVPCSFQHLTAGSAIPGFQTVPTTLTVCAPGTSGGPVKYNPWTTVGVNLSNYVGQQVTVICTSGDCTQCGHFGYTYLDFSCGNTPVSAGCWGSPSTICAPADPGASYQWSTGAVSQCINVTPNPGDTYTVTVMTPSGCGYSMHYEAGNGNVQALFTYAQNGGIINFTNLSTGSSVYNWSFGDGAFSPQQDPVHSYLSAGTYSACLTAGISGCSSVSCKSITVASVTSVKESELLSSIFISPNPASENIFLDFNENNFGEAEVSICNVIGEKIHETNIPASGKHVLDVSKFPEGVYFVKIITDAGTVTKKIILH